MKQNHYICILTLALATAMACFALAAEPVFAQEDCDISPAIKLEVPFGAVYETRNLTHYIAQIYEFIVGAIGVMSAVLIMWNGFKWATAAGNQERIGSAKEGLISAVTGLVIGLASYSLLFLLGPQYVNLGSICPTGVDLSAYEQLTQGSAYSTAEWTECPNGSDAECSAADYCTTEGADCECDQVGTTEKKNVCRPHGVDVMPDGSPCYIDDNCQGDLFCKNESATTPGVCTSQALNASCSTDADCEGDGEFYKCVYDDLKGFSVCQSDAGREDGENCDDDEECASGVCHSVSGVCDPGDETSDLACFGDEDCLTWYRCENNECVAAEAGDSCSGTDNFTCSDEPHDLFCVDKGVVGSVCRTGMANQPCDDNDDCVSGIYCVDESCSSAGTAGEPCDDEEDCMQGFECCQPGMIDNTYPDCNNSIYNKCFEL